MWARNGAVLVLLASLSLFVGCSSSGGTTPDAGGSGGSSGNGGSAGSHDGGDAASVPLSCDNIMLVLGVNCTTCHSPGAAAFSAGLDLQSDGVAQRLVGKPAATATATNGAMCAGKGNLLNRGTLPATGILIDKINASTPSPSLCGSPMPLEGAQLQQEDLDCLQAWANGLVNSVGP
jgi:hypothetical protein